MRTNFLLLLLIIILLFSCGGIFNADNVDYREEMRKFVQEISEYAKSQDSDFIIIPQNGHALVKKRDHVATSYLNAVDGLAQESLFFGSPEDDQPTSATETNRLIELLEIGKARGNEILVTDYVSTSFKVNNSYSQNQTLGYLSFAAPDRDLRVIPDFPSPLPGLNSNNITSLYEANNFLYLLNKSEFETREDLISSIQNTNYDIIITDAFFWDDMFSSEEIEELKQKENGGKRLVISYLSIGEAEDYRYYWQEDWEPGIPKWIVRENPNWEGNYKVQYWSPEWKEIIYDSPNSYLQQILDAGFDGVYLDIIDGFRFFENR
ncbi:MAG: endo alpha-1,4 polygalactosaminidase [Gracilimonas sp.]|nr:endo alpha-1,4 polygalactosaminidase [Gracilimonas sp.]